MKLKLRQRVVLWFDVAVLDGVMGGDIECIAKQDRSLEEWISVLN